MLVTGPANSGKAGEVLGAYRERLDEEPILVVPSFADVERSRRELAGRGAVFGTTVARFAWLFETVAERAGYRARRLSPLARRLIVEQAVAGAPLRVLRGSAESPGFALAAARFVAELERSMIEPARLRKALEDWAGDGPRRGYASEIASLYEGYRRRVDAAGAVTRDLFAWRALDALRAHPSRWGASPLFVYGFDDFTPQELALLELLATGAGVDVTVSLPYESGRPAFRVVEERFRALERLADEHVAREPAADHYAPESRAVLHHLERHLYGAVTARPDPGAALRLLAPSGERAEVELVAAEVLKLLRGETTPGDIAVVYRSPDAYGTAIEQVFRAYGIPFSLRRRAPLGHTGLGRGVLGLIRCAVLPDGEPDDLLAWLRACARYRSPGLADGLEARVRREAVTGVDGAREMWEDGGRRELPEIGRLRDAQDTAALLAELESQLDRAFAAPFRRAAPLLSGSELDDARVFEAARAAIADMRAVLASPGAELGAQDVHDTLAELPVSLGDHPRPGLVQVTDPGAIRARRFAAVFVCGLQEGEFPRAGRPEPFLPDDDRIDLAERTGLRLPVREDQLDRERYLFYACASRAERLLVLSARTSDEEGDPAAPSFLVEDVKDLFAESLRAEATTRLLSDVTWPEDEAPTLVEWQRAVAVCSGPRRPVAPSRLCAPEILEELGGDRTFSASQLEAFADCPVKWMVERLLNPQKLEPDPEQMVRGSYAHAVLERTFAELPEATGSPRVSPETLAAAEEVMRRALRDLQPSFPISPKQTRVRAAVRRLEFDLLRYMRGEAESDSRFTPAHTELEFGRPAEDALPPASLGMDGMSFSGKIDRVDTCDGHALVVDYKTGKRPYPVGEWQRANRLQVAVYMLAVEELLAKEAAGGVYVALGSAKTRGLLNRDLEDELGRGWSRNDVKPEGEFREHLEQARATVRDVIDRIRAGRVAPSPDTCAWNDRCSYPAICREESGR